MQAELFFLPVVKKELDEIVGYYENQKKGLGLKFLKVFELILERISQYPLQLPIVHKQIRRAGLKNFPYNIYFRLYKNQLIILAVFHQKRNPELLKQRK